MEPDVRDAVHARATEARERNGGADTLQSSLHYEEPAPETWWRRYFKWEALTMAPSGRVIEKGWVVPQPLGVALLLVILGGVGVLYWRIIDKQVESDRQFTQKLDKQNELLTRLDQALIDKEKNDAERNEGIQKRFQNSDAVDIVMNRDIQTLKVKAGIR